MILRDALGDETIVAENAYSVSLATSGGTVTFGTPPAVGVGELYVISEPSFLQSVEFASGQPFLPSVVNNVNDRSAARDLVLRDGLSRSIRVPIGEASPTLPPLTQRAGKVVVFGPDGGLIGIDTLGVGSGGLTAMVDATTSEGQTVIDLPQAEFTVAAVFRNGSVLPEGAATIEDGQLHLNVTPDDDDFIKVILGYAIDQGVVAAGKVIGLTQAIGDQFDTTVTPDKGLKFKDFFGFPTADINDRMFFFHGEGTTAADDQFSMRIDRRADFDGGTFGFLNSVLRINSVITGQSESFEAGVVLVQDNYADTTGDFETTPQHHGMVIQHNRYGTAPGFCQVLEAVDKGAANPTEGCGAQEVDIQGTGDDTNLVRYGTTYIVRRAGGLAGWTGDACVAGYGIVFARQPDDAANNRFVNGIGFGRFGALTQFTVGIDFTYADCSVAALRLANERLDWGGDGTRTSRYESLAAAMRYEAPGGKTFDMADNGDFNIVGEFKILGDRVVTSRRTGWAAATGTATRTTFATSTVTTAQLAERLKALIDDLTAHGLIGA
ncbi:hypothetical protein [Sphingobium xenophagum]|uniref:hypothetical protein n=1 Tax=Sphingobium xenophagum TaxID=121428 RepID=UPI0012FCA665|nr:hypothetical protein [Sphingobium xenophagum]